jgi:hypothetical protein
LLLLAAGFALRGDDFAIAIPSSAPGTIAALAKYGLERVRTKEPFYGLGLLTVLEGNLCTGICLFSRCEI